MFAPRTLFLSVSAEQPVFSEMRDEQTQSLALRIRLQRYAGPRPMS